MKFRYYITDLMNGCVKGTDKTEDAIGDIRMFLAKTKVM